MCGKGNVDDIPGTVYWKQSFTGSEFGVGSQLDNIGSIGFLLSVRQQACHSLLAAQ